MLEGAAEDKEDEVEKKIANSNAEVPEIEKNNNDTKQGLDNITIPDLTPLRDIVEGQCTQISRDVYFSSLVFCIFLLCIVFQSISPVTSARKIFLHFQNNRKRW